MLNSKLGFWAQFKNQFTALYHIISKNQLPDVSLNLKTEKKSHFVSTESNYKNHLSYRNASAEVALFYGASTQTGVESTKQIEANIQNDSGMNPLASYLGKRGVEGTKDLEKKSNDPHSKRLSTAPI